MLTKTESIKIPVARAVSFLLPSPVQAGLLVYVLKSIALSSLDVQDKIVLRDLPTELVEMQG